MMERLIILGLFILGITLMLSTAYGCVVYKNFMVCGVENGALGLKIAKTAYKIYEFYTEKLHLKMLPSCDKYYRIIFDRNLLEQECGNVAGCITFDKCVNNIIIDPSLMNNLYALEYVLAHELAHAINHYYNPRVIRVIDESFADAMADYVMGTRINVSYIHNVRNSSLVIFVVPFYCIGPIAITTTNDYKGFFNAYSFSLEALYIINTSIQRYIEILRGNNITLWWYSTLPLFVTPSPGFKPGASPHLGESHSSFRSVGPLAPIIGLHLSVSLGSGPSRFIGGLPETVYVDFFLVVF